MSRLIVYGDIHGCFDAFKRLRKKIKPKKNDIEVCVGDFIAKGDKSYKTTKYLMKNNILSVLGNHEQKAIMYKDLKDFNLLPQKYLFLKKFKNKHWKYLLNLPFFLKFNNITIMHGGITNYIKLNNLKKDDYNILLECRYITKSGKPTKEYNKYHIHWSDIYGGDSGFIVYGHTVYKEPYKRKNSLGLDTGYIYGNKLCAAIFKKIGKKKYNTENIKYICVKG